MSDGTIEQRFLCHLTVNGVDLGVWDKWDGGGKGTASVKYRSGGSPNEESLGGPNTFPNVTLSRNYRLSRDQPVIPFLLGVCGTGEAVASKQPLDRNYNAVGEAEVVNGIVVTVTPSVSDSTSSNPAIISVELEVNSYA